MTNVMFMNLNSSINNTINNLMKNVTEYRMGIFKTLEHTCQDYVRI